MTMLESTFFLSCIQRSPDASDLHFMECLETLTSDITKLTGFTSIAADLNYNFGNADKKHDIVF